MSLNLLHGNNNYDMARHIFQNVQSHGVSLQTSLETYYTTSLVGTAKLCLYICTVNYSLNP